MAHTTITCEAESRARAAGPSARGTTLTQLPRIDAALLAVNGLRIWPALNRKVVMNAQDATQLCATLKPRYAIPMHYAFTGGPIQDRILLKYDGTAEEFARATAQLAPETSVRILVPGEPLRVESVLAPSTR